MAITNTEREIAGANIRRLCKREDVSIRRLSMDLVINRAYLHDIVSGNANPTMEMYEKIAAYFEVTVRDLLTESNGHNGKRRKRK